MEKFNNSFADFEISKSIEARYSKHPLYKIERLVDWEMIASILQKADFRYEGRVGGECYSPLFMFMILFIQRLCGFSDEQMEDQIYANLFYKAFCRISLDSKIPDSTTIGRWR
ncbi:MAG: transposase, partial [Candidatus Cloacimonetes bacterium]|nr:transposase [Candidatus Cloacimonadota bacterium]